MADFIQSSFGNPVSQRRAAMYVRMSTDHQKYSTENQADAIREYADKHNIDITKIYTDSGKSGLSLDGRDALKQLIEDVREKNTEFSLILVLDVTRWGRFQDADESAFYEYTCRSAGIDVHYVAEQFENDGSPVSTIVKGVKRAMAGEYSRELSGKVFAGQCRLIELGYRQGGSAGYGLRRMLVDEHGQTKTILERGQQKSLQTDRIILVPGPDEEVQIIRWIYRAFVEEGLVESAIADQLNRRGILSDLERAWTKSAVHQILTNEKYIGNNVFNRVSFKLKKQRVVNTPEMWIRADAVFDAIVQPSFFYTAQGIIRERARHFSNEEMLTKLRNLHDRRGWLSGILIDDSDDMPSSSAYSHRFGSLISAYQLVGYTPDRDFRYIEVNRHLRTLYPVIVEDTIQKVAALGGQIRREVETDILHVNEEIRVSIVICRCQQTPTGSNRWKIRVDAGLEPDLTVAIRMQPDNLSPLDYYLLPALDIEDPNLRLAEENHFALDAYRFDDLEPFFLLARRAILPEFV